MKRLLPVFLFAISLLALRPLYGQATELAAWAPADSAAFVTLALDNPAQALRGLNIGAFVGAYLQPPRTPPSAAQPFDAYFPLGLLDLESASFSQLVLPWLGDSLAVAYRPLDLTAGVRSDGVLLILPARDPFAAADALGAAVRGQDLLTIEALPGGTLYLGDRAALAVTATTVLIGGEQLVRDALATYAGDAPALLDAPAFVAVTGALPAAPDVLIYAQGDATAAALPALFSLNGEAAPLLAAYGAALENAVPARALLTGSAKAIGAALDLSATLTNQVRAEVVYQASDVTSGTSGDLNAELLTYLPRSAMLAYATANAGELADAALAALPFVAAGPGLLSAFPLGGALPPGAVALPDADLARAVVSALTETLAAEGLDWPTLRAGLTGSAALALLPRPNNPQPISNLQADILLVVESADASALAEAVDTFLGLYEIPTSTVRSADGLRYRVRAGVADESALQFGAAGDVFLLGTGAVMDEALRARSGDNRLIDQPRWAEVGAPAPGLYLDIDRLYNVYLPVAGGSGPGPVNRVSLVGAGLGEGLFSLTLQAAITLGG